MRTLIIYTAFFVFSAIHAQESNIVTGKITVPAYSLHFDKSDPSVNMINNYVEQGLDIVSSFFNKEFKNPVHVYLMPSRDALDTQWQKAWNMPSFKSQCWMVGSGVESRLDLLSPAVWGTQACEHDPNDEEEIRKLIYHELTHVLHSDYNISPSFTDINNIDWFVEGLATYVSGQLDPERLLAVIDHVRNTGGPTKLSMFWKGEHKYGLSGSMIYHIDSKYGRETVSELLRYNDVDDILEILNTTEQELIDDWRKTLLGE